MKILSPDEVGELASLYEAEWDAAPPQPYDAVIADIDDGELISFITSEAMIRLGMLWLTPRLRNTIAGAKRVVKLLKWLKANGPRHTSIVVFADEPQFETIAERMGMRPIEGKVYRIEL